MPSPIPTWLLAGPGRNCTARRCRRNCARRAICGARRTRCGSIRDVRPARRNWSARAAERSRTPRLRCQRHASRAVVVRAALPSPFPSSRSPGQAGEGRGGEGAGREIGRPPASPRGHYAASRGRAVPSMSSWSICRWRSTVGAISISEVGSDAPSAREAAAFDHQEWALLVRAEPAMLAEADLAFTVGRVLHDRAKAADAVFVDAAVGAPGHRHPHRHIGRQPDRGDSASPENTSPAQFSPSRNRATRAGRSLSGSAK